MNDEQDDGNPFGKPDRCRACTLFKEPGIVPGDGPERAPMMFVGQAPGEQEALDGKPFTGGSGRVTRAHCAAAGVVFSSVYVTNVVKCRPPGDRSPSEEEIRCCAPFLIDEVKRVNPNLIVALGNTALYALTGRSGISKYRGVPLEGAFGKKVLATFNAAYVMRDQSQFAVPIFDLQRARKESAFPDLVRVEVQYNLDANPREHWPVVLAEARATGFICKDLETTNLDPRTSSVICVGVGSRIGRASCFRWTPEVAPLVFAILADPSIEKVGQNSEGFDWPFLEHKAREAGLKDFEVRGPSFDTMLAFHLTNSELSKDLGTVASFYTDMEYWKDKAKEDLFKYNCQDVDATTRSYFGLKKELESLGMTDLYYKHVMPLQPVLRRMTRRGIRKNEEKALAWSIAMRRRANELEHNVRVGLGRADLNVDSPKQLQDLLYREMGLPVQYTKATRTQPARPTTNEEALEKLMGITGNKVLGLIIEIRTLRKYASTFVDVETDDAGYVHPRFGTGKAANGRLNSWEPNAQNIPRELREIYVPDDPDYVIMTSDWNQVEFRLDMVQAADISGMQLLALGRDNHRAVWSDVMGVGYDDVTEEARDQAKFIVYGVHYGRQAESIAEANQRPLQAVQLFINRYARRFPQYWAERVRRVQFVQQHHYLANPWGRRRWWYARGAQTEIYNHTASSTAADMMYEVLVQLDNQLPKGATVRLTVHDEVVLVVHKDVVREAATCTRTLMQQPWPLVTEHSRNPDAVRQFYPNGWFCPADVHLGNNWREAKKGNKALEKELLG